MSLARRIIDLAKENLNALLERASEVTDPRRRLASIPDVELEAELARRRSARVAEQKVADAKARIDGGTAAGARMPQDREARERAAREREARVRAAREARERLERERAQQRASRPPPPGGGAPPPRRPGPSTSSSSSSVRGRDPEVARYYERLEIPYGSNWEAVRSAYRRLMRKYHPDLHGNKSPEKQRAATEVAQALTQAYNELEKRLVGGPNRR